MKQKIILPGILFLVFISFSLAAEMQVGITLLNNTSFIYNEGSTIFNEKENWGYGGDFDLRMTVNPGLIFEDNFQADALLDLYCVKPYDQDNPALNVKQAYIDLLFHDALSLKVGYIQSDYGFSNNYFNPMKITEYVPEFRTQYPDIILGASNLGMPGIPSLRIGYTLPEFVSGLSLALDQALVWFDYDHFENNYFLTSLSAMYNEFQAGAVLGFNGNSFGDDSAGNKPVLGVNASMGLPFRFILLWEGLLRQESFRPYVDGGAVTGSRDELFFNQSVRLETSLDDPLFYNNLSLFLEYFHYAEGLSDERYDEVYSYLASLEPGSKLFNFNYFQLLINERNFNNYITFGSDYVMDAGWYTSYQSVVAMDVNLWQHRLTVGKAFDNVTIGTTAVYYSEAAVRYQLINAARDMLIYFHMSMDL